MVDYNSLICNFCKRKLKDEATLRKHCESSELHATNLKEWRESKEAEVKALKDGTTPGASSSSTSTTTTTAAAASSSAAQAPPTAPQRHWAANKLALTKPDAAADLSDGDDARWSSSRGDRGNSGHGGGGGGPGGRHGGEPRNREFINKDRSLPREGNFGYSDRGPRDDFGGALPRRADRGRSTSSRSRSRSPPRGTGPKRFDRDGPGSGFSDSYGASRFDRFNERR